MKNTKTIQGIEGWEERFTELDNKLLKVVYGYLPSGKHRVHRQLDEIDFISNLLSQQATALTKPTTATEVMADISNENTVKKVKELIKKEVATALLDSFEEIIELVEKAELPNPNPYGRTVTVTNVNRRILRPLSSEMREKLKVIRKQYEK